MRREDGLTFLGTIFLVLLIAIFVFAVVYFTKIEFAKKDIEDLNTDMLLVQAKVKKLQEDYILKKKEEILIGTKISDMQDDEVIKQFMQKKLFDQNEKNKKYYVLNNQNLQELGLNQVNLRDGEYFVVEYIDAKVYCTKGLQDANGKQYYTLSDFEEVLEENSETESNKSVEK